MHGSATPIDPTAWDENLRVARDFRSGRGRAREPGNPEAHGASARVQRDADGALRPRVLQARARAARLGQRAGGGKDDYPPLTEAQLKAIRAHQPARKPGGVIDSLIG